MVRIWIKGGFNGVDRGRTARNGLTCVGVVPMLAVARCHFPLSFLIPSPSSASATSAAISFDPLAAL